MIFSNKTIEHIRKKSGLSFDRASDFSTLASLISNVTKHSIGITTLKRLFGYIDDSRETNKSTLNIIALYLGYSSWEDYISTMRVDSDWNVESETLWIAVLPIETQIEVSYLNRVVIFEVLTTEEGKALKVIDTKNSSLRKDDIVYLDRLKKGEPLEARKVYRGQSLGSYRTNGEVRLINIINSSHNRLGK